MKIQEVEIFIKPNGDVSYEVRGLKGKKCLDLTKELELDLGGEVVLREDTSEMHERDIDVTVDEDERLKTKG